MPTPTARWTTDLYRRLQPGWQVAEPILTAVSNASIPNKYAEKRSRSKTGTLRERRASGKRALLNSSIQSLVESGRVERKWEDGVLFLRPLACSCCGQPMRQL